MQSVFHIITAIFISYISLTNTLAYQINTLLGYDNKPTDTLATNIGEVGSVPATLSVLPSDYRESSFLPDILLQSADYQQAAVISAIDTDFTPVSDPIEAIVNIYCTSITKTQIRTTTGSGFFVNPNGIIMTNAHVAQFLLLEKTGIFGNTECFIRNGNPASAHYKAELLYISPAWVKANASLVSEKAPSGTGERDYALLYIKSDMDDKPVSASTTFPALQLNSDLVPRSVTGSDVTAAGYPAGDLIKNGADTDLIPKEATTSITELYTFGSNYADVFAVKGSIIGEQGASGGPVVSTSDGRVIGMITTRGDDARDGVGSLRAITISHINRTITEETGFSLSSNLSGNLSYRANIFTNTMAPFLTKLLLAEVKDN